MRTTRNEALKLDYGIPASTPLLFVLARADELEEQARAAYRTAAMLEDALGGEALAQRGGGAFGEAYAAARRFSAFLDESGLREAGERAS